MQKFQLIGCWGKQKPKNKTKNRNQTNKTKVKQTAENNKNLFIFFSFHGNVANDDTKQGRALKGEGGLIRGGLRGGDYYSALFENR